MNNVWVTLRKNRTLIIILAVLAGLFVLATQGMGTEDWVITLLRAVAAGAITFLVAAGLSLILGLLDVLNLAHGTVFMIGAYVGWTTYVRPDTFVDLVAPILLLAAGLLLQPFLVSTLGRLNLPDRAARIWPWIALAVGLVLAVWSFSRWPLAAWQPGSANDNPTGYSLMFDQAMQAGQPRPVQAPAEPAGPLAAVGLLLGGSLLAAGLVGLSMARHTISVRRWSWRSLLVPGVLLVLGLAGWVFNDALTVFLTGLSSTVMFAIAIVVALVTGAALGSLMESTLVRPLYSRPVYQLLLTLGLGAIGIELVQALWGRVEFTMPKPALFQGTGEGCPATSVGAWLQYNCSTFLVGGARVRVYNEVFVILVGVIVLVAVWLLLQRSRLGMVIRAGVQDSEMVEALGINVRRVFTQVFALGSALATLGGIIAAPSMGLSPLMGQTVLLTGLIALAIGGLTSFPGAAAGALLVGVLQQFIIKYGQIGISLPFLDKPFKPTPPIVPAATVLLMVIILLVLPQGLLGRKE